MTVSPGSCERRLAVDHHLQDAGMHRKVLVRFRMDMRDRIASAAAAYIEQRQMRQMLAFLNLVPMTAADPVDGPAIDIKLSNIGN